MDSCEQYIVEQQLPNTTCEFEDGTRFNWSGCVATEEPTGGGDGGAGMGLECPGWYAPETSVHGYEPLEAHEAIVSIDRQFVEDLRADAFALFVCDDARYVEHENGQWIFENIEGEDLLFALGVREGDRNAVVEGFDPQAVEVTTVPFPLDSLRAIQLAYDALHDADGIRLTVDRPGLDGGFTVWISID